MSYFIGVDMGSAFAKAVLTEEANILSYAILRSSGNYKETAEQVIGHALSGAQVSPSSITSIAATGYGANSVPFSQKIFTEVSCQAMGTAHLLPDVRTILDAGDMYCRVVRTDGKGKALSFLTSATCAGGSSRVLEVVAHVLHVELEQMGELSLKAKKKVELNTGCAVFAETDVVSLISEGNTREDILAGLHRSLAAQIHSLAERLGIERECAMIGGGAKNIGLVRSLEESMGIPLTVPDEPQIVSAYGAALLAKQAGNKSQP
jgi:predicted CoA-substrate-specific enzyme activase